MNALHTLHIFDHLGYRLVLTSANVIWQSSILFAAITIIVLFLRNKSAPVRHKLWVAMLLVTSILPFVNICLDYTNTPRAEMRVMPQYHNEDAIVYHALYAEPAAINENSTYTIQTPGKTNEDEAYIFDYPWAFVPVLYLFLLLYFLFLTTSGLKREKYWRKHGTIVTDPVILTIFGNVAKQIGLPRAWTVISCDTIPSPATIGIVHPVILIPSKFKQRYSCAEKYAAAIHELSHIKRHDIFIVVCMSIIKSIYFYNPFIWLGIRNVSCRV